MGFWQQKGSKHERMEDGGKEGTTVGEAYRHSAPPAPPNIHYVNRGPNNIHTNAPMPTTLTQLSLPLSLWALILYKCTVLAMAVPPKSASKQRLSKHRRIHIKHKLKVMAHHFSES